MKKNKKILPLDTPLQIAWKDVCLRYRIPTGAASVFSTHPDYHRGHHVEAEIHEKP
jgi:hypothetical protein